MRTAVLLINLGSPDNPGPGAVGRYLAEFLNDRRVIDINPVGRFFLVNFVIVPFRSFRSSALYRTIWGPKGSPLINHTADLAAKLRAACGDEVTVEYAMRYRKPSIPDVLERIRKSHPDRIVIVPLYPQYASSSTGTAIEQALKHISRWEVIPTITTVGSFFDHPSYIDALVKSSQGFDHNAYDHVLFSYHGLPERQIRKASAEYGKSCELGSCCDSITGTNRYCYRAACFSTTRSMVKALNIPEGKYSSAFQSRLDDKWLKPYSDKVIAQLAEKGARRVLVFSPAFVADCLETIHEIGVEYDEIFREHGGEKVTLVPSLNAGDVWVHALKEIAAI